MGRSFIILIIISVIISMILLGLGLLLSIKGVKELSLLRPFECGFRPRTRTRPPFSLHFMIIDVELIIIFPFYLHLVYSLNIYSTLLFIRFVIILILGLFNE